MKFHNVCANCSQPFESGLIVGEIIIECPSSMASGGQFEGKVSNVLSVLSIIYKWNYLNQLPSIPASGQSGPLGDENDQIAICDVCAKFLSTLYKSFEDFGERRHPDSYVSKRIKQIDGIFNEIQATWSHMENCTNFGQETQNQGQGQEDEGSIDDIQEIWKEPQRSSIRIQEGNLKSNAIKIDPPTPFGSLTPMTSNQAKPIQVNRRSRTILLDKFRNSKLEQKHQNRNSFDLNQSIVGQSCQERESSGTSLQVKGQGSNGSLPIYEVDDGDEEAPDVFQCSLCPMSYVTSGDLVDHLWDQHTEDRTLCPVCKKVISYAGYMKTHLNSHVGNRPFKCSAQSCEAAFSAKGSLKRHVKFVHYTGQGHRVGKINSHRCLTCNRSCRTSSALKAHMLTHTEDKPYNCPFCEYTAAQSNHLGLHFRRVHSNISKAERAEKLKVVLGQVSENI